MDIISQTYDTPVGDIIHVTLTNATGASVTLSNLGAGIVAVKVPDARGTLADVTIGYDDPAAWMSDGPCAGKTPGRYANRIALGKLAVDGKEYQLSINNGPNALHGGPEGFQNRLWHTAVEPDGQVTFTLDDPDGHEQYPGNLHATVTYRWSDDNTLSIDFKATTDAPTVVNLTNHAYFNLKGHGEGDIKGHLLQLNASNYLPTDATQIPTGTLAPVAGTPMDFTAPTLIGAHIGDDFEALKIGKGYDHCWAIDGYTPGTMRHAATLSEPTTGRILEVHTTQPGVQVYTGNWLEGCPRGKDGAVYHDYSAVALECQHYPDAPHHPAFPSTALNPGETFNEKIEYRFKR